MAGGEGGNDDHIVIVEIFKEPREELETSGKPRF